MSGLQRRIARLLFRWHRLLGVMAALFILTLAISGVLLNHTSELGLDRRHVTSRPLLAWYGIKAPDSVPFYAVEGHYLSQWSDRLLLDDIDLGPQSGALRGVVASNNMFAAALDERLLLLLGDGQLVDILDVQTGLPTPIQRIGLSSDGAVVLSTPNGLFIGHSELSRWEPGTPAAIQWSEQTSPPELLRTAAETRYLGEGLPLERVIADLHSGRLFTRHGPWLMDLVALILIFSTLSGLWLWWRNHLRPRRS
jgi:hypothetical protein